MSTRTRFRPVLIATKIGVAVLLFVGLFGLRMTASPVQGMDWQPVLSTPVASQVNAAASGAVRGTLASFTALIPEILSSYLPLINK